MKRDGKIKKAKSNCDRHSNSKKDTKKQTKKLDYLATPVSNVRSTT